MPVIINGRRVVDASGIAGAWDLTFSYWVAARTGVAGANDTAADPGGRVSLFEALEQQLGLRLVEARRPMPVFVLDHVEENPSEN